MITVKRGDRYPVRFTANMDLTGATVKLFARRTRSAGPALTLDSQVIDATNGVIEHVLAGDLEIGTYKIEAEANFGTEIVTFPTGSDREPHYEVMKVVMDLG